MFNNFLEYTQEKSKYLHENSLFLQHIDKFILVAIVAVFVSSTFFTSDGIGFIALIATFLTIIKLLTIKGEKIEPNQFEMWLLAFFMIVIISLAGSTLFMLSLKGFMKTLTYLGFYFSLSHFFKTNTNKIPHILATIALCVGFEGLVGFLQNFAKVEEISTWQDVSNLNPEDVMTRVYGTLKPLNPNLLGGYFVAGIPALLSALATSFVDKKYKSSIVFAILTVTSVIALFLTGCRGAYIGMMVIFGGTFLVSAKFFWQNYKTIYLSFVGSCIGLLTAAVLFVSALRARVFSIFAMRQDSSNSFRFNVYNSALEMFKDNWLLGIGVGNQNFREIYGLYMRTGFDALSAYNVFLEISVESGIFALIAFVGFLVTLLIGGVKIVLKSCDIKKVIYLSAAIVSIVAVMVHGIVDTVFFRPQIQFVFWAMVAIVSALEKETEKA